MPERQKAKKLPKGVKLIEHDDRECKECFYRHEVDLIGDTGFACHKDSLKLLVEVAGGLFMPPDTHAVDGTPLRKVRRTGGGYDCYDQEGNTYAFQDGQWVRIGASYPKNSVGPREISPKITIAGSQ